MSKCNLLKSALVFSILAGMVVMDCGPLANRVFAQRPSRDRDNDDDERRAGDERGGDEGGNRREGRGGWGRRRGGGGFGRGEDSERRSGERERGRDENDDEARDNDSDEGGGPRIEGWARSIVKENDKNGDMMLQEDERSGLRGPAARADLDNDNVITVEEIVRSLSDRGSLGRGRRERRSGGEENEAGSDRAAGKSEATAKKRVYTAGKDSGKEADKRKSYRFTPAQDRLTGDLPSWFKSRDRNKDGQVSMSEYGRSWNARLVRQFQDIDLNDDGVVTPKEAAE